MDENNIRKINSSEKDLKIQEKRKNREKKENSK